MVQAQCSILIRAELIITISQETILDYFIVTTQNAPRIPQDSQGGPNGSKYLMSVSINCTKESIGNTEIYTPDPMYAEFLAVRRFGASLTLADCSGMSVKYINNTVDSSNATFALTQAVSVVIKPFLVRKT